MNRTKVERSFEVLARIWGFGEDRDGYVFLPWITGTASSKEERRNSWHESKAFEWSGQEDDEEGHNRIIEHMLAHTEDDLYFCPNVFNGKKRVKELVELEVALWADLDEQDPHEIEKDLRPTLAWMSSPGTDTEPPHYQGIWLLRDGAMLASSAASGQAYSGLNQRLSYHIGADPSGWDATQLLRPPGWTNHKYTYREQLGYSPKGKLLWVNGPFYDPDKLSKRLPDIEVAVSNNQDVLRSELRKVGSWDDVFFKYRTKLKGEVRKLLSLREPVGDRSQKLHYIELSLAEAGASHAEIVRLTKDSCWNKFEGRGDELQRLSDGANKAIAKYERGRRSARDETRKAQAKVDKAYGEEVETSDFEELEEDEEATLPRPQSIWSMLKEVPEIEYLVEGIWTKGGIGILFGTPKSYKTMISYDLMLSIASGKPFLNEFKVLDPGPVLFLQDEDPPPVVRDQFEAVAMGKSKRWSFDAGGDKPEVTGWVMSQSDFTTEAWQYLLDKELEHQANTGNPYRMVFLDPLNMISGDVEVDRYSEITSQFLKPLKHIAAKHGIALMLVHHSNKTPSEKGARSARSMMGSQALYGWVTDMLISDRKNEQTPWTTLKVESKVAAASQYQVKPFQMMEAGGEDFEEYESIWLPYVTQPGETATGEPSADEELSQRSSKHAGSNGQGSLSDAVNATHAALQELGAGAHSVPVIVEAAGIKEASVRSQLGKLYKGGIIDRPARGLYRIKSE